MSWMRLPKTRATIPVRIRFPSRWPGRYAAASCVTPPLCFFCRQLEFGELCADILLVQGQRNRQQEAAG
jgi:hypothetical protein